MSKKAKKGTTVLFKPTPKIENEVSQVQELQMKKKLFEDKLCKFYLIKLKICSKFSSKNNPILKPYRSKSLDMRECQ
jgi:hypothetical protein